MRDSQDLDTVVAVKEADTIIPEAQPQLQRFAGLEAFHVAAPMAMNRVRTCKIRIAVC
jgi:hypothetical protein